MDELTQTDFYIIHVVFDELTRKSLGKWTTLIPKEGKYRSTECFQQWLITGQFNNIRRKARIALGLEKEVVEEELDRMEKEADELVVKGLLNLWKTLLW